MQQVSLHFNSKMLGKGVSKNIKQLVNFGYYKGKTTKETADMFSLKNRTVYIISYPATTRLKRIYRQAKKGNAAS